MFSNPDTNSVARTLHELGLAAWFGGALMGATALNPASGVLDDPDDRLRVANAVWGRWMPVAGLAIGSHLIGAAKLTTGNAGRITLQEGVARLGAAKAGLTAAALAATVASGIYGRKVMQLEEGARNARASSESTGSQIGDGGVGGSGVRDATTPEHDTDTEIAAAQRTLSVLQWAIPALTGGLIVLTARMGEQQRPMEVLSGVVDRLIPGR